MKNRYIAVFVVIVIWNIVLTCLFFSINGNDSSQTTITEENVYGISTDLTKVSQDSYTSVVNVKTSYGKQSGFIYKQENDIAYIVTTYHGVGNDNTVSVTFANGKTYAGTIIGCDYLYDIAVISIESPYNVNVVKCGDNEYIKNGEFIININSSDNKETTNDVALGIVSNKLINILDNIVYEKEKYDVKKEMISLSLNSSEGCSGSPVFNMKSEVIGMIQMRDDRRTYALTINEVKMIVDNIISNVDYKKIELGVKGKYIKYLEEYEKNMLDIPFEIIDGYYIDELLSNSSKNNFGLQVGDIILTINNSPITCQRELLNCLYLNSSDEITIVIYRGDNTVELKGLLND